MSKVAIMKEINSAVEDVPVHLDTPKLSFEVDDRFNRKDLAEKLTEAICKFSPFYDDSYVLSLNAPFGSGKSTFIEMWQNMLQEEQGMECIYLNAWEHDFDDEPIVPILSTLLAAMPNKGIDLRSAFFGAMASTTNDLIAHKLGVDVKKVIKEAGEAGDINSVGAEIYKGYHFKKEAFKKLRESLTDFVESLDKRPLVIFVDELDRARPDYSIRFLETIKHMFPVQGICFVLSVDKGQLEKSVAQVYGDIDFKNYYLRFATNEVSLPELAQVDLKPFLRDLRQEYIDEKRQSGIKYPFKENDEHQINEFIADIAKGLELKPREIQKLYRRFSQFMAISENEDKLALVNWVQAAVLLVALSIVNPSMYHQVGKNLVQPEDFTNFIKGKPFFDYSGERNDEWVLRIGLAFSMTNNEERNLRIANLAMPLFGYEDPNGKEGEDQLRAEVLRYLSEHVDRWRFRPNSTSAFSTIYTRLESWSPFL
ncbi:MAG: P-loop NTPase fold protein [Pseudomonadota bacterium]|nr:P-loop NTPase fold protein [Pseudomonadota bacterium]